MSISIRPAAPSDIPAISALIRSLSSFFLATPDGAGAEAFLNGLNEEPISKLVLAGNFRYTVAVEGDSLVGVLGIRDSRHIYHLFVAESHQRRGIARQLWLEAIDHIDTGHHGPVRMTVNSSVFAVGVYESFGFKREGDVQSRNGVNYVPMALQLVSVHG